MYAFRGKHQNHTVSIISETNLTLESNEQGYIKHMLWRQAARRFTQRVLGSAAPRSTRSQRRLEPYCPRRFAEGRQIYKRACIFIGSEASYGKYKLACMFADLLRMSGAAWFQTPLGPRGTRRGGSQYALRKPPRRLTAQHVSWYLRAYAFQCSVCDSNLISKLF